MVRSSCAASAKRPKLEPRRYSRCSCSTSRMEVRCDRLDRRSGHTALLLRGAAPRAVRALAFDPGRTPMSAELMAQARAAGAVRSRAHFVAIIECCLREIGTQDHLLAQIGPTCTPHARAAMTAQLEA